MNNIIVNFDQILDFAKNLAVPIEKKRGVLREYLQAKFISIFYSLPKSEKMSFIGGTSLRLLRDLPRFSEDLDFDNLGLSNTDIEALVNETTRRIQLENIEVILTAHLKDDKTYFDIKFPNILRELKLASNPHENLMIKFDYSHYWKGQKTEIILFSKYGFINNVITNPINQMLVQKLTAYVNRRLTQPRDIYDIVWLFSQGAKLDREFIIANNLESLLDNALEKYRNMGVPSLFEGKLGPFLFNVSDVAKMHLLEGVLNKLKN